jgi:DNA helicase-2/ATP-dependent DNA helicase PcrA
MLQVIGTYVERLAAELESRVRRAFVQEASGAAAEAGQALLRSWQGSVARPLAHRLYALERELQGGRGRKLPTNARVVLEREVRSALERAQDVVAAWSDLLSDRKALGSALAEHAPGAFSPSELDRAHAWCAARCAEAVVDADEQQDREADRRSRRSAAPPAASPADDHGEVRRGIDGRAIEELPTLDREDDTLLLHLHHKLCGPLLRGRKGKEALIYEHVFVDEAQDLSPVELAVVVDTLSRGRSLTLAGDVAQRLCVDNGFTDWQTVLGHLGLSHVDIEPLRLSYRSTQEIIDFAQVVLGPLADQEPCVATRHGVPVELFSFAHSGEAAGFLAESLRDLLHTEPQASVAVVARFPEQADIYYAGLRQGECPRLRRILEQDFPFRPGIDVTDVRQVKGLEFDYVVLVEVNHSSYPDDDLSRHLLHIAATRAAHQLWVLSGVHPSPLLPRDLVARGY